MINEFVSQFDGGIEVAEDFLEEVNNIVNSLDESFFVDVSSRNRLIDSLCEYLQGLKKNATN